MDGAGVVGSLASLAALATDRARHASSAAERSEWFERMAHTDPLTGIANERTVARVLELELARAGRQGGEVSLALFDVDDFRSANASDGHQVGDDILRRVAAVLAESVRLVDTVGRIGGDEFVLVAPGSAGAVVARRVQDGIAALPAVAGRAVSVSAGRGPLPGGRDGCGVADRGRDGGPRRGARDRAPVPSPAARPRSSVLEFRPRPAQPDVARRRSSRPDRDRLARRRRRARLRLSREGQHDARARSASHPPRR